MKLYNTFGQWDSNKGCVVSIGMFDGVHIGHKLVIRHTVDLAKQNNIPSVIISFGNHPSDFFLPNHTEKLLTISSEKENLMNELGVDYLFLLPFDEFMANMSADKFVNDILIGQLHCQAIVLGYDNHFGKNREGTIRFIKEKYANQLASFEVSAAILHEETVSSSFIKKTILNDDIPLANQYLGYPYEISGTVIEGNKLGRTIGFPTANLQLSDSSKLLPTPGVYESIITIGDETFNAITNIGFRPTIEDSALIKIETHILAFDRDIYGAKITIYPGKKIRNEIKFESIDQLIDQIKIDLAKVHIAS
jgi:riboflavin kinase/FMN adenylyltransferase